MPGPALGEDHDGVGDDLRVHLAGIELEIGRRGHGLLQLAVEHVGHAGRELAARPLPEPRLQGVGLGGEFYGEHLIAIDAGIDLARIRFDIDNRSCGKVRCSRS